ncbi:MAG: hypothetical protein ACREQ2_12260, partial [Candidatus Binatia bacterium]
MDHGWVCTYGVNFGRAPLQSSKPYPTLPEEVIYVGETKRLDLRPLAGLHHRLEHYRETFPNDPGLKHLYVSVCRVCCFPGGFNEENAKKQYAILRVYTQYVEAKIYWEYTQRWEHPPA